MKEFLKYLVVVLKGIGMGAANIVPGVSGGTIAFLTGIYRRLVKSISSVDSTAVKLLFTGKFRQLFRHIDGWFLVSVLVGVVISTLSLAKLMTYCMQTFPVQTWAFFFGLIVASCVFILKDIHGWKAADVILLVAGIALGVVICTLTPTHTPDALWFIFISGAISICAMILPGISGSFLLLILGKYEYIMAVLGAIVSGDAGLHEYLAIIVFLVGAVVGILAFAKLLNKLLDKWFKQTLVVLAGFIIGSLVKVWPWSNMEAIVVSQFPEAQAMLDAGALSKDVVAMFSPQTDLHIWGAVIFAVIGLAVVFVLEWASARFRRNAPAGESETV